MTSPVTDMLLERFQKSHLADSESPHLVLPESAEKLLVTLCASFSEYMPCLYMKQLQCPNYHYQFQSLYFLCHWPYKDQTSTEYFLGDAASSLFTDATTMLSCNSATFEEIILTDFSVKWTFHKPGELKNLTSQCSTFTIYSMVSTMYYAKLNVD